MSVLNKLLAGASGIAALAMLAGPAAAQGYPGYGYGYGYPQSGYGYGYGNGYNNNVGNAVGNAINGVIGALQYGNYPYGNYGYNQHFYGIPANVAVDRCARAVEGRFGNGGKRVTGIMNVEGRSNGALRVHGYASDYSGYGYGQPNLTFTCRVNRNAQVEDLEFDNRAYGYNNYNGYNNRYRGW